MGCCLPSDCRKFAAVVANDCVSLMIILIKLVLALFLIAWSGVGLWMVVKYENLFGWHPDDPSESSGARALNMTQVWSVWFGFFAVAFYFLIR